jgi:hypothetical protein
VRELDGIGHARDDVGRLQETRPEAFDQQVLEQLAIDLFEREIADLVDVAGVEHGDDVRMMQSTRRLCLPHERLFDAFVCGAVMQLVLIRVQLRRLDHEFAMQYRIEREIGGRIAVASQYPQHGVAANCLDVWRRNGRVFGGNGL